jgi:hypothetical protein
VPAPRQFAHHSAIDWRATGALGLTTLVWGYNWKERFNRVVFVDLGQERSGQSFAPCRGRQVCVKGQDSQFGDLALKPLGDSQVPEIRTT